MSGDEPVVTTTSLPTGGKDEKSADSSVDNGIIAVSVIVPLIALVLILVGGYFWYRRRYPVRMIIGRDVSKFTNPKYSENKRQATLVRNDAENFFNQPNDGFEDSDTVTLEMNPASARWQQYDNPGYQRDDVEDIGISGVNNHDDDYDEEERKFREKKSWLFRRSEDKGDGEKMRGNASDVESIGSSHSEIDVSDKKVLTDSIASKVEHSKRSSDGNSIGSDASELLNEQQVTPRRPRRGLSKEATTESSSTTESVVSSHSVTVHDETLAKEDTTQSTEEDKNGSVVQRSDENEADEKEESNFMKTAKVIFEQPSLEQVMAEVKARSRSMSVGTLKVDLNTRQRSYSVDPSKSARKSSLHDETILAAYAKSVAARKILEAPISSASSHHSIDSPKQPLTAQSSLSASIVGVDIKVKMSSNASTISGGSSLSIHSIESNDTEGKHRGLSLVSSNSNPHLVTDLDSISQNSEDGIKTSKFEEDSSMKDQQEDVGHENVDETRSSENKETQPVNSIDIDQLESAQLELKENEDLKDDDANKLTYNQSIEPSQEQHDAATDLSRSLNTHIREDNEAGVTLETEATLATDDSKENNPAALPTLDSLDEYDNVDNTTFTGNNLDTKYDDINLSSSDSNSAKEEEASLSEKQAENEPTDHDVISSPENNTLAQTNLETAEPNTHKPLVSIEEAVKSEEQIPSERHAISNLVEGDGEKEKENKEEDETLSGGMETIGDSVPTQEPQDNDTENGDRQEENELVKKPIPAPRKLSRQSIVEDEQTSSDEDSSDEDSSETSESNDSGTKASYSFGADDGGASENDEKEGKDEESSSENEEQELEGQILAQNVDLSAGSADSIDKSKTTPGNISQVYTSRSDSIDSDSHNDLGSASASGFNDLSGNLQPQTSPKRVKILPLAVNISDDDDSDEDDADKEKYKLSDDDISDILGSSSDDNESGDVSTKDSSDGKNVRAASPTTYTFQNYDSDDDDIDV